MVATTRTTSSSAPLYQPSLIWIGQGPIRSDPVKDSVQPSGIDQQEAVSVHVAQLERLEDATFADDVGEPVQAIPQRRDHHAAPLGPAVPLHLVSYHPVLSA